MAELQSIRLCKNQLYFYTQAPNKIGSFLIYNLSQQPKYKITWNKLNKIRQKYKTLLISIKKT